MEFSRKETPHLGGGYSSRPCVPRGPGEGLAEHTAISQGIIVPVLLDRIQGEVPFAPLQVQLCVWLRQSGVPGA